MAHAARVRGLERRPGSRAWRLLPSLETRDPREQATPVAVAYFAALAVGLATVKVVPAPALVVPATALGGGRSSCAGSPFVVDGRHGRWRSTRASSS